VTSEDAAFINDVLDRIFVARQIRPDELQRVRDLVAESVDDPLGDLVDAAYERLKDRQLGVG